MTTNPLKTHVISAAGCDGTILEFLNVSRLQFKYHNESGHKPDFAMIYRLLSVLAIGNTNTEPLLKLVTCIETVEAHTKQAALYTVEAEKCMRTMAAVIANVSAEIDQQLEAKRPTP